jgi:cob(I)alamin adenosyltransferase
VYDLATKIQEIQERLLDIGSHIATPLSSSSENHIKRTAFSEEHTSKLEQDIDAMDKDLPALTNFIIPGSTVLSSHIHVCRAVCRRAERTTVVVAQNGNVTASVMKYLNRLSDWLFVAARFVAQAEEAEEIRYKKKKDQ